jgi:hypothetical protein
MQQCFYVCSPKRFLAALQLFKTEDAVEMLFEYHTGMLTLTSLLLSNVAMLQVQLIPHVEGVILPSNKPQLPTRRIALSTKHLLCTFGDICKTPQCRYVTLDPEETLLKCCAFDVNNRESGHYTMPCLEDDVITHTPDLPTVPHATVSVQRGAHDLVELLGTVADTTISSEESKHRLVWTIEDTSLVRTRYLYTNPEEHLQCLRQMFIKSILQLLKGILQFLQRTLVELRFTTDQPLHLRTVEHVSHVRVHFMAAPMDEGSD